MEKLKTPPVTPPVRPPIDLPYDLPFCDGVSLEKCSIKQYSDAFEMSERKNN